MQRHLKAPPVPVPTLSVEEEAILEDQNSEAEIAVDNSADEIERITDVAATTNDTLTIVNEIPEIGSVEEELVSAVAEMAVAGTDANPDEVLAVNGAGTEGAVSTEGIASVLKSIWDAIVTSIKNLWVGLKHWLTTYFSRLEQNKKHAEKLIARLDDMKGYVGGHGDIMTQDILGYGDFSGLKNLFGSIDSAEKNFHDTVPNIIKTQFALMHPLGDGVADAFGTMKAAKPQGDESSALDVTDIAEVVHLLNGKMVDYCKKLGMKQNPKDPTRWATDEIGNMRITAKGVNQNVNEKDDPFTQLAHLSQVRFSADQSTNLVTPIGIKLKNDATPETVKERVQTTLDFINTMLAIKADQFAKLEQQVEKVQKACEAMLNQVKQDDKKAVTQAKAWMPLASAYANWATQPAAKLMVISARHNKFWLTVGEMATNNFVKAA